MIIEEIEKEIAVQENKKKLEKFKKKFLKLREAYPEVFVCGDIDGDIVALLDGQKVYRMYTKNINILL